MSAYENRQRQAALAAMLAGTDGWGAKQAAIAGQMAQAAAMKEAQKEQEKKEKSKGLGKIGGLVAGLIAAPLTGGMSLPAAMAVSGGASALGTAAGQMAGGGGVDMGNVLGAGLTGAGGTMFGRALSPMLSGGGTPAATTTQAAGGLDASNATMGKAVNAIQGTAAPVGTAPLPRYVAPPTGTQVGTPVSTMTQPTLLNKIMPFMAGNSMMGGLLGEQEYQPQYQYRNGQLYKVGGMF